MTTTDSTEPNEDGTRDLEREIDDIRRTIEENKKAADRLFAPSPDMPFLLWQVCGAWETVVEEVRFFQYTLKEEPPTTPPFVEPSGGTVARDMRRIARKINLMLPSDTLWTIECKRAKTMRDHLGHMLHFRSIEGMTPNQSVTLVRVPYRETDEMTTDSGWARHRRIRVTITEHEAREVLEGLSYINESLFALRKFGMEFNTWPDHRSTESVLGLMRWWLDDWGPRPGENGWIAPTMGQLRRCPKVEFDASLPPSMRPEF